MIKRHGFDDWSDFHKRNNLNLQKKDFDNFISKMPEGIDKETYKKAFNFYEIVYNNCYEDASQHIMNRINDFHSNTETNVRVNGHQIYTPISHSDWREYTFEFFEYDLFNKVYPYIGIEPEERNQNYITPVKVLTFISESINKLQKLVDTGEYKNYRLVFKDEKTFFENIIKTYRVILNKAFETDGKIFANIKPEIFLDVYQTLSSGESFEKEEKSKDEKTFEIENDNNNNDNNDNIVDNSDNVE